MKITKGWFSSSIEITPKELLDLRFADDTGYFTRFLDMLIVSLTEKLK